MIFQPYNNSVFHVFSEEIHCSLHVHENNKAAYVYMLSCSVWATLEREELRLQWIFCLKTWCQIVLPCLLDTGMSQNKQYRDKLCFSNFVWVGGSRRHPLGEIQTTKKQSNSYVQYKNVLRAQIHKVGISKWVKYFLLLLLWSIPLSCV